MTFGSGRDHNDKRVSARRRHVFRNMIVWQLITESHPREQAMMIKLSYHRGTYPGQELDYRFRTNVEVRTESGRILSANSWEAMNPPRLLGDMKVLKRRGGFDITASLTNPPSFKRVIELGPYGNNPWELA